MVWGLGGQLGVAVVNFPLIPRIVRGFGEENYGAYLLMLSCAGWIALMHMGAGVGIVRYVAEGEAAGDPAAAAAAARRGAALQLGFSLLAAAALWAAAPILAERVFVVPAFLRGHETWLIRAAAVGGFFSVITAWALSVFQGYQRFRRLGVLSLAQGVLPTIGTAAVLASGRGLLAAATWYVAVQAGLAVVCLWGVRSLTLGAGDAPRTGPGRGAFWRYCLGFWPGSFAQFASGQLDRAFIAGLRSLSEFTLYAVPLGLLQRLQMLPAVAGATFLPVVGELPAEHGHELQRLYLRCTRVLAALLAPAYALLFALMPQFLSLWLGGRFGDESVWPARVMVLTQAAAALAYLPITVAGARRGGVWPTIAQWSQAAVCLALWPLLIPRWGLLGAALGSLAAQVLATAVIAGYTHRKVIHLGLMRYALDALGPAGAGTLLLSLAVWPLRARVGGWGGFSALCALGGALYAVAAWSLLPAEDRRYLLAHAPVPNRRRD